MIDIDGIKNSGVRDADIMYQNAVLPVRAVFDDVADRDRPARYPVYPMDSRTLCRRSPSCEAANPAKTRRFGSVGQ